jgi:hypothetical protein
LPPDLFAGSPPAPSPGAISNGDAAALLRAVSSQDDDAVWRWSIGRWPDLTYERAGQVRTAWSSVLRHPFWLTPSALSCVTRADEFGDVTDAQAVATARSWIVISA